jgi:NADH dehydrogenase
VNKVIVTGAAGFVGKRLIESLLSRGQHVTAIDRNPKPATVPIQTEWIQADLARPASYEDALQGSPIVLHLAAVTGKAHKAEYWRSNVDATQALVNACERARVRRFVLMSSIAVTFGDRRFYPYAISKIAAEGIVRAATISTTIVRPTMIFGPGSPVQASLERLARLPLVPIFGDGRKLVQPVDVADVVGVLADIARDPDRTSALIEVGGSHVYTLKELILTLRSLQGVNGRAPTIHVPLNPLRQVLALLEGPFLGVLPFTAGQLASFANDGVTTQTGSAAMDRRPSPSRLSSDWT